MAENSREPDRVRIPIPVPASRRELRVKIPSQVSDDRTKFSRATRQSAFASGTQPRQIGGAVSKKESETREELIQHLQKLSGRTLRTREDIQAYVKEVSARKAADDPSVRRWLKAKQATLLALLAFGILQYYILDVLLEIVSLQQNVFFVPASAQILKSMLSTIA